MRTWYLVLPIVTLISVGMRLLPFLIAPFLQRFAFLQKLSTMLPCCLLILMTAHSMKEVPFTTAPFAIPEIAALGCVLITQYCFRTLILSMLVGIATHQLLMVAHNCLH